MRKLIKSLLGICFLSIALVACSGKIEYSKEFSYLPITSGMKKESFIEPKDNNSGMVTYIMENKEYKDVVKDYKKILEKDKWSIEDSKDGKDNTIKVSKEQYNFIIVVTQSEKNVKVTIIGK